MEVRQPRAMAALAWLVYPLEEPQLAAMTPSHVRRAQLVWIPDPTAAPHRTPYPRLMLHLAATPASRPADAHAS